MTVAENLHNPAAEFSVVASMIFDADVIAEVVGTQLMADDFILPEARLLYETAVTMFHADRMVEPLTVAEECKRGLATMWEVGEPDVADELLGRLAARDSSRSVIEHAAIVKRLSTARQLLKVTDAAAASLGEGKLTPEEIAGRMSTEALAVTSGTAKRTELVDWMQTGTAYAKHLQMLRRARELGIEIAVHTDLGCIDDFLHGIMPDELVFLAGEPGCGKSILAERSAEGFARRQMVKPVDQRIATLVVSMEMGEISTAGRVAQSITNIDGTRLREGDITDGEYRTILREWKARDGLPIIHNFASNFRLSQLRALVVEAIRQHNVGFVVLDHFRKIDPDRNIRDPNEVDEVKVRFLKESIAKDLNVAVLCLAHTIKLGRDANQRPRQSDLRGSGQIAANADFVGILHRPGNNLDEDEKLAANIRDEDAELYWEKARYVSKGVAYFSLDPSTMSVGPR